MPLEAWILLGVAVGGVVVLMLFKVEEEQKKDSPLEDLNKDWDNRETVPPPRIADARVISGEHFPVDGTYHLTADVDGVTHEFTVSQHIYNRAGVTIKVNLDTMQVIDV